MFRLAPSIVPNDASHVVVFSSPTVIGVMVNRQAYILVNHEHPYFDKDSYSIDLAVHGGITVSKRASNLELIKPLFPKECDEGWWIVGWDYNHASNMSEMMAGISCGKLPVFEEVYSEVEEACKQALQLMTESTDITHQEFEEDNVSLKT